MNARKMMTAALAAGLVALFAAAKIHAQNGGFTFFGPLGRVITPNGDGINDRLFLCFDNFSDSGVSGKIYTVLGAEVASMGPKTSSAAPTTSCPGGALPQYISWDGHSSEGLVRSGMYVYRIEAEGKIFSGTFLVVR